MLLNGQHYYGLLVEWNIPTTTLYSFQKTPLRRDETTPPPPPPHTHTLNTHLSTYLNKNMTKTAKDELYLFPPVNETYSS